jgi:zinc protease
MSFTLEVEHEVGPGLLVRRHRMDSGLALIVLADHAAPIVTYQTWYGVGSRSEEPGKTGMAHLFEHLMFNRTESLGPGEFDRLIEGTGGDSNAATWVDWTYYRDTVPARDLALCARLEAERMAHLVLEPAELEAERDVVVNERLQRVDDDLDGFLDEALFRLAFTSHPYRWPTIGWMADIKSLALDDVRRFYQRFYAPNNATLVVVGAVEERAVLDLVERHYGELAPATLPTESPVVEARQVAERRETFAKPTATARLLCGYRVPGQGDPDWAVLSLINALLSSGPSSRLYRRLVVERETASAIGCDVSPFRDPGLFRVAANLTRGASIAEVEGEIDDALAALATTPVDAAELAKVKDIAETDFWAELDTVDGKAEAFGHYQTSVGDFRALFATAERLAAVTAEDILRVASEYLRPDAKCVLVAEPSGDDDSDQDGEA